jgi:2-polyprenyl-3-methyl-5-hydroxy-6-metoxy-1,4-benzoquinol methylase
MVIHGVQLGSNPFKHVNPIKMIRQQADKEFQLWSEKKSTEFRAERRSDYWLSQMQAAPDKSVMEIGCGSGFKAYTLARKSGMNVFATDIDPAEIELAKRDFQLPNLNYKVVDSTELGKTDGSSYDYIVGNGILHHLYNHLDSALSNILRILKDNGKMIFIEPNIYNPFVHFIFSYPSGRKLAHLDPDEMAFSKSFITKKLIKAGFKDIKVEYKDFLLPGIPNFLIQPSIAVGNVLESIPLVKNISQSIFISAVKK